MGASGSTLAVMPSDGSPEGAPEPDISYRGPLMTCPGQPASFDICTFPKPGSLINSVSNLVLFPVHFCSN